MAKSKRPAPDREGTARSLRRVARWIEDRLDFPATARDLRREARRLEGKPVRPPSQEELAELAEESLDIDALLDEEE